MDDDALTRQVRAVERELAECTREVTDLKRQVTRERQMREFAWDRLDRLERSLHGKIGWVEAIGILWVALPSVFVVVTLIAVGLILSKPHP
jgi:hypothetical protein